MEFGTPKPRKSTICINPKQKNETNEAMKKLKIVNVSKVKVLSIPKKPQIKLIKRKYEISRHLDNMREIFKNSNATPIRCKAGIGYACCFCSDQYPEPSALKKHVLLQHDEATKCSYMKGQPLANFIVKIDITDLKCNLCNKDIENLNKLLEHLKKHGKNIHLDIKNHLIPFKFDSEVLLCVVCKKESNNFKVLLEHMNTHYRNYICSVCDVGFVNKRMLQTHSYRHKIGEFICPQCSKTYDTKVKMKEHERAVHIFLNKRNKCGYCGERFTDYTKKNDHEVRVHGVKAQVLKCHACDKVFDNQRSLTVHTKTYHLMDKRVNK